MKKTALWLPFIITIALAVPAPAQVQKAVPAKPAPALDLQDGDTFVFLGDSITHECLYTQYVENFFYTRYPERRIRFHSAGVSGDKAADALARFDEDVAAFHPKYVSVHLGMNDGRYEPFNIETFETYANGMTEILDRIGKIGAKPIVFSPTMFDHHQLGLQMQNESYRFRTREFAPRYNALLAFYGGWLREQAGERGLPFVNQWGPMNDHTFSRRRTEPDFTLVTDAIHPAPAGHFLMAYEFLWQVTPDRRNVSSISITPRGSNWRAGKGVTDLVISPEADAATFTHLAPALPWVIPAEAFGEPQKWDAEPAAPLGYKMTNAGHRLSNERLRIAGLAPGSYEIRIDSQPVGKFSHITLGSKIELQSNAATPQYQQALEVAELNRERNDKTMRPLRNIWGRIGNLREKFAGAEPEKFAAEYEKLKPQIADLLDLARDYEDRIYAAAQPVPRKYEIRRIE